MLWRAAFLIAVALISQSGADLKDAVQKNDLKRTKALLEKGGDPNQRETLTKPPSLETHSQGGEKYPGDALLALAIDNGSLPMVKLLLEKGAKINEPVRNDEPPLAVAVSHQKRDIVAYLLTKDADPNLPLNDPPINSAANTGDIPTIEALLKKGARLDLGKYWTPLTIAAVCGQTETIRFLLKKGANPNFSPPDHPAPLDYALGNHNEEAANLIRQAGGKSKPVKTQAQEDEWLKELERERAERAEKNKEFRKLTPDDSQVIETAIMEIADNEGAWLGYRKEADQIVLVDKTTGDYNQYSDYQMTSDVRKEHASEITLEMREDLARRNSIPTPLTGFVPASPRIVLKPDAPDLRDTFAKGSKIRGYVAIDFPGYNQAHTQAVLRFSIGPTAHGATCTSFLVKKNGTWQVKWHAFAFYV